MISDTLKELATILGGSALVVAALAYLSKSLLTHWIDKDLERHKSQLESQNAIAVEKLRSDLLRQSLEHEVTYRRNDEKVAEVDPKNWTA